MVKKLLKHELIAYSRVLLPMFAILLGVSLLTRFVAFFQNASTSYSIIEFSSWVALIVAMVVCLVMTEIFSVTRFYKNLFTHEGYLSFTLPVTPTQHIFTKLLVSLSFQIAAIIICAVSFSVATMGEVLFEVIKAGSYLIKEKMDLIGSHIIFYGLELFLCIITAIGTSMLLFYTCIALGQTFKKNRVLAAFGIYFAYYFITQIIETVFMLFFTGFSYLLPLDFIWEFLAEHPFASVHIIFCAILIFEIALGALYYFITSLVIKKRLNLE
ncbi:MAG: hypothetical protein J6Q67_06690 [Clostridia bacterium]|nr:hypothetical protein [Clostridia bacterium]